MNHTVSTVGQLDSRADLQFISDSQDCAAIRYDFGPKWDGFDYDSYFVRVDDGEYKEIWGMSGIVPFKSKLVTKLLGEGLEATQVELANAIESAAKSG